MTCEEAQVKMAESWAQSLNGPDELAYDAHLLDCEACRNQSARLQGTWRGLASLPADEPSPKLRVRFYETLSAYVEGSSVKSRRRWPLAWQIAAGVALLIAGGGAGYALHYERSQVARLHEEVAGMRQLVALTLLQQQSASDRLQGCQLGLSSRTV